ncbi:MocR-like pyridoxine biosynthesis transcription factor PdxR [Nocardioides limicola]|uniref:MocR-like pyridoxine biosynthesis transcription factor PdxR n=1 Tax=Nocardioides limicola TaxID=2803368 RepID=UPI00193C5912|nr:PLP-dependent aminotransferase family protein [Nocardioides sp. DJM-14]
MTTPLAFTLDRDQPVPLAAQVAHQLRAKIARGSLPPGARLPSSRRLARDLGVARSIIEQAFGQLVAEGWLEGRQGSGTFVSAVTPLADRSPGSTRPASATTSLLRLDSGTPWIDPRHRAAWRRAWREVAHARPPTGYLDPRGIPELREALAERLARTRGLDVAPDEVLVCAGTTDGLRHLLGVLPAGPVSVEDPGYRAAVATVLASGRTVRDTAALEVPDLSGVVAHYATPAHQHPLGVTMPAPLRLALLTEARRQHAVVIEDDYDSEFRYDVAPVPALAALDRDQVGYLGTASKTVAPSLRLGWLVAPTGLNDQINETRALTHDTAAWPVQQAFLSLLRDGYVDKVVRSAREVYADRAARVVAALGDHAPDAPIAGMYACVDLAEPLARTVTAAAAAAGFEIPLLSDYCRTTERHGLVLGFGGCTDEELDRALAVISRAVQAR